MSDFFSKVLYPLESAQRKELFFIFLLTIITTIFELLGIGLIIPILSIFVNNDYLKYTLYFQFLDYKSKEEILIIILFILGFVYFLKFFVLRYLILKQNEFSHKLFTDISRKFFKNYLYKNFIFHIKNNSSKLIRNIQGEANLFSFGVVFPLVRFFTELIVFISICIVLIIFNTKTSILTIIFFSLVGFFLLKRTTYKLKYWGNVRQFHSSQTLRHLQQGFKSIREIIINGLENIFLEKFHYHNLENAKAGKNKDTITQMPRLILELIGISTFIILILFLLSSGQNISEVFVIVGVFFFASIRLLPAVSKIVQSVQAIKFNSTVIDLVYDELLDFKNNKDNRDQNIKNTGKFNFDNISFNKVEFSYSNTNKKILNNVNINIKKGEKIGIIGKTGSGKSTFINLFCGLLNCDTGKIEINNKNINEILTQWQNIIGYVPQSVSIIDESILFNITLENDVKKIDLNKVEEVLKIVELHDHIYNMPNNVYELAGENGVNLSGGQCQRLGIARAIYRDPSIIILDEATSSLDEETENLILEKLFKNVDKKTIISISHRKSSLKNYDKIIEFKDNQLIEA